MRVNNIDLPPSKTDSCPASETGGTC